MALSKKDQAKIDQAQKDQEKIDEILAALSDQERREELQVVTVRGALKALEEDLTEKLSSIATEKETLDEVTNDLIDRLKALEKMMPKEELQGFLGMPIEERQTLLQDENLTQFFTDMANQSNDLGDLKTVFERLVGSRFEKFKSELMDEAPAWAEKFRSDHTDFLKDLEEDLESMLIGYNFLKNVQAALGRGQGTEPALASAEGFTPDQKRQSEHPHSSADGARSTKVGLTKTGSRKGPAL